MLTQQQNVLCSFAQGRQMDFDGIDAVQQILPETPVFNHFVQGHIGCRNHPHIDGACLIGTHPGDYAVLQRRKQFSLQSGGEVADFIQKNSTPVGCFKTPGSVVARISKSTFDVAKKFTFKQGLGDSAQVHFYKMFIGP